MKYIEYKNPKDFLDVCRSVFEEKEALYGLMLGISLRLVENPLHYGSQPLLVTINNNSKVDLVALMTPPYKLQIALLNTGLFESIKLLVLKLQEKGWHIPAVMGEEKVVKIFESYWNKVAGTFSHDLYTLYGFKQSNI